MSNNPLVILQKLGQSPWHDAISRDQLRSGELARLVRNGDITGLTSNPTIFQKAMSQGTAYDADLRRLARKGRSSEEIFYSLAIDDLREAADLFSDVHERTGGRDGFVSIEVSPRVAYDTNATIDEALRLWKRMDRPNLMVKIPATKQGLPAIEQCVAEGLNINVTLIFSLERYDEVMNAYLTGLIRRTQSHKPVDRIHSVASFFVSRVDTLVDKLLDEKIERGEGDRETLESLKGKAAIANAKLAYEAFRQKFATETFAALHHHGANLQRPLWASTSTKNPDYPATYYVDALVGPDSVDTMPPATIEAYRSRGDPEVRIDSGLLEARTALARLAEAGIDMAWVTHKLEEDGVKAFADSFEDLLKTVDERRKDFVGRKKSSPRRAKTARASGRKAPSKKTRPRKAATVRRTAKKTTTKKGTTGRKAGTKRKAPGKTSRSATASSRKTTPRTKRASTARRQTGTGKTTGKTPTRRKTAARKTSTGSAAKTTRRKASTAAGKSTSRKTPSRKSTARKKSGGKTPSRRKSTSRTRTKRTTAARKPAARKTVGRKSTTKRTRRSSAAKSRPRKTSAGTRRGTTTPRPRTTSKRKR